MEHSERRLVAALKAGDESACTEFVNANHGRVYQMLVHLTGNPNTASELTQETFVSAWRKIGSFNEASKLSTWLHRIAYNKFIDRVRREQRKKELSRNAPAPGQAPATPRELLAASDEQMALYAMVQALPEAERTMIVLHYLHELSYREMAELLNEPSGTIKWRTSKAISLLQQRLRAHQPDR